MLISFDNLKKFFNSPPRGVIHVGAHKAEELGAYIANGINSIIWVEANPHVFGNILMQTQNHAGSSVHWFAAHEKDNDTVILNIANNGESSSIFQFGTHSIEHPHIHFVNKVPVKTRKIDSLIDGCGFSREKFDFVNIDIQGAELLALKGMQKQLQHVNYIYLEVNEKPLYEGCALIGEIDEFLKMHNFSRKITEMTQHGWGDAFYAK